MAKCIANKQREMKTTVDLNKHIKDDPHRLNSFKIAPRIIYIKNEKEKLAKFTDKEG
jgi:hypothetical protein